MRIRLAGSWSTIAVGMAACCASANPAPPSPPLFANGPTLVDSTAICVARIESDPSGGEIVIDGERRGLQTPAELTLEPGLYRIEVQLARHATLAYDLEAEGARNFHLTFVLLRERPEEPTAEALGLNYESLTPIIPEESAVTTLERFLGLAEVFSVLPLGAGLSLKVADRNEEHANALMATGFALTLSSYATGKWLSSRRLNQIRRENKRIQDANGAAKLHNAAVDQQIKNHHQELIEAWEVEVLTRGNVMVRARN